MKEASPADTAHNTQGNSEFRLMSRATSTRGRGSLRRSRGGASVHSTLRDITNEHPGDFTFGRGDISFEEQWPELTVAVRKEGNRTQGTNIKHHPSDAPMVKMGQPHPDGDRDSSHTNQSKIQANKDETEVTRSMMEAEAALSSENNL